MTLSARLRRVRRVSSHTLIALAGCVVSVSQAAPVEPIELGRLFYTPAQRAQLETARARFASQPARTTQDSAPDSPPAPLRFDGVMIRSDGKTTHWVDGKAQAGAAGPAGLKPGQIRANGRVYEPYQVLRPSPAPAIAEEPKP